MSYQSYRDLKVYQLAHKLAVEIHEMTLKLPKFEMYEEGAQVRRSSKSVTSNIVEGYGRRRYKAEFIKFLIYALASCDETRDHLDNLFDTKPLKNKKIYNYLSNGYDTLGKQMSRFIKSIESGHKTRTGK
jgi:four helix bundle protein